MEREPLTHLQHEVLDVVEDAVFQFSFGILVWRSEEFRHDRILQRLARNFNIWCGAVHEGADFRLVF